jgi:hypothetical protein
VRHGIYRSEQTDCGVSRVRGRGCGLTCLSDGLKLALLLAIPMLHPLSVAAQTAPIPPTSQEPLADYDLPPPPVVWGNVTRDAKVDLLDLNMLAQNWNEANQLFTMKPDQSSNDAAEEVLGSLQRHWKEAVPGALRALGWDNRNLLMGTAAGVAAKVESQPIAVGRGVQLPGPTSDTLILTSMLPVFVAVRDLHYTSVVPQSLQIQDLPGVNGSSDPLHRYTWDTWAPETDSIERYFYSFSEESAFKGFDLSVNARYAAFNGSLDSSFSNSQYRNAKEHRFASKLHKDFGWYEVKHELARTLLADGFMSALANPDPSVAISRYGTHYVSAVHLFSELYVEVTIKTTQVMERTEAETKVKAAIGGSLWSANARARLQSMASNSSFSSDISIRITRKGGPIEINVPGVGKVSFPMSVNIWDSSATNILNHMGDLQKAWAESLDNHAGIAVGQDYFLRPITDFLPDSALLPFSRERDLRTWFEWYVKYDTQFKEVSLDILANRDRKYRYLAQTSLTDDLVGKYANWYQYYEEMQVYYQKKRDDRKTEGRLLLADSGLGYDDTRAILDFRNYAKPAIFAEVREAQRLRSAYFNNGNPAKLVATLSDGSQHSVWIALRK